MFLLTVCLPHNFRLCLTLLPLPPSPCQPTPLPPPPHPSLSLQVLPPYHVCPLSLGCHKNSMWRRYSWVFWSLILSLAGHKTSVSRTPIYSYLFLFHSTHPAQSQVLPSCPCHEHCIRNVTQMSCRQCSSHQTGVFLDKCVLIVRIVFPLSCL